MFNDTVNGVGELAASTAVEAAWAQWSALTSAAVPIQSQRARAIIDPEALLLASIAFGEQERRLVDLVASWTREASFLISLPRLRSIAALFPGDERLIAEFSRFAVEAGDQRWRKFVSSSPPKFTPRGKRLSPLNLIEGPALTLRLRAGIGVNAKAELLAFLLGMKGAAASLKVLASVTRYTERNLRSATAEMVLAGFIQQIDDRPVSFYVQPEPWALMLQNSRLDPIEPQPELPSWRFWAAIYSFLAGVLDWSQQADREGWTAYVASSRARDLVEAHEKRLRQAQISLDSQVTARATSSLDAIGDLVRRVRSWTVENL